ncbi:hypothetical protein PITCH_A400035 [uncultured Desulfobacterium sp.]|uniref:Uncharacterized protein n=1 Tax=uncultured Desulfobacterium sp. TaxID=201089 RepID=A0A445MZS2_9BACT|nr:hypothetical protein PITCH_A400035 [uncultured Desulfobacterium sp.]
MQDSDQDTKFSLPLFIFNKLRFFDYDELP